MTILVNMEGIAGGEEVLDTFLGLGETGAGGFGAQDEDSLGAAFDGG